MGLKSNSAGGRHNIYGSALSQLDTVEPRAQPAPLGEPSPVQSDANPKRHGSQNRLVVSTGL